MKTESNNNKMAFDMYPSISGKTADPVREVVMKYIDYFLPDASGTSAVAIDNKIEQAMDLVKSHLMIAVREEVEVLKEKISELMDKINQLEVENTILKANMSQETLQQLQMQTQLQIAGSNGPAAITAAATNSASASGTAGAATATNSATNSANTTNAAVTAASTPTETNAVAVATATTADNNNTVIPNATVINAETAEASGVANATATITTNGPLS